MKHVRNAPVLILLFTLAFFVHANSANAAVDACPGRPTAVNWSITGSGVLSVTPASGIQCSFSPSVNDVNTGTKSQSLNITASSCGGAPTCSCSASLTATNAGGPGSASDVLNIDTTKIWINGACVTPPVTCTAPQVLQNGVCVIPLPTASLTIDGAHSATLVPGQVNTKTWSSTGGTSWSSSYVMSGTCNNQGSGSWSANTANGSVTNTANAANSGCTAIITYTVSNSVGSASDTIYVTTSATPAQNTPSGNITSNSCTISAGASSCGMSVAWSSSNMTGAVTVQRPYAGNSVYSPPATSGQTAYFPSGTFNLDLYDGTTNLATGTFTASCVSGSSWNGSTCYAPVGTPSASISQSSTVSAPGEAVTISWSSSNVTSCAVTKTVNGGAPFLPFSWTSQPYPNTSGSGTATPGVLGTHTFYIDCTGPYGSASNSVTHTVANNPPPPPPAAQVTCTTTSSPCTSSATNSCGQTGTGTTNRTSCTDGSNSSTACSASTADPIVSASISASPPRLPTGGGTATLSLSVSGANTCTIKKNSVVWKTLTSSSCSLPSSVSDPAVTTQTKYSITCSNATYSASASSKLVNVGALFNEF